jgi:hypothetical protein
LPKLGNSANQSIRSPFLTKLKKGRLSYPRRPK